MSAPANAKPTRRKNRQSSRAARAHWFYTIEDARALYGVSRNTIRNWMRYGLKAIDAPKTLFRGLDMNEFHARRRKDAKVPCSFEEIYCVCCKRKHSFLIEPFKIEERCKFRTAVSVQCPETGGRTKKLVCESDLLRLRDLQKLKSSTGIPV